MRRFRLRRLWRVNGEAIMIAAGQNLKRLLKKRGWGRRPCPAEAIQGLFWAAFRLFLAHMWQVWPFSSWRDTTYSTTLLPRIPLY
jgi:hypothetical protein